MNTIDTLQMRPLDAEQLETVTGGSTLENILVTGESYAIMYWAARNYLSETVYPYWLD